LKCPICERLNIKSKVYFGEGSHRLHFYNENGVLSKLENGTIQTQMHCANAHKFIVKEQDGIDEILELDV